MTTIRNQTYIRSYLAHHAERGLKRKPLGWGAVSVIFSAALVAAWLLGSVMGWPV